MATERKITAMGIFSLRNKVNDLFARSNHHNKQSAPAPKANNSDSASADDFLYGIIDRAGQRDCEQVVYIPQGKDYVAVYYNAGTREARPIPVAN